MSQAAEVTDFLKITSRLIHVLEREIEMLRAMKPTELQSLQQDKIVLAAAYEAQLNTLKDRPERLEAMAPAARRELREAIKRFEKTLAQNERSLRAAKQTTERVLRAIAEEVERQRSENQGYSASGAGTPASRTAPRQPVSVAIDERF